MSPSARPSHVPCPCCCVHSSMVNGVVLAPISSASPPHPSRHTSLLPAMLPLDGDYVVFLLVCATAGAISLLLLLQVYMVCFLKQTAPVQVGHQSSSTTPGGADAAEAPAGGGADASTWAALPGASCVWAGDEEAGDCVVCLSALQGEEQGGGGVRVLPRCRHAFHDWCIARWLVSHSVCCPICRTPARPDHPAAAPEVVVVTSPPLPPQPPPLVLAAAARGDAEAGGGFFSRRGAMLRAEHQVGEELHLPLLLLY